MEQSSPPEPLSHREVYRRGFPIVWSLLKASGVYRIQDREDLTQEIFSAVFRRLDPADPPKHLEAWLRGFTWNYVQTYRRTLRRRREESHADIEQTLMDDRPNPEERTIIEERDRIISAILDTLPERRRLMLIMREFQGLDVATIAAELGITEKTVFNTLTQARADFAKAARSLNEEERQTLGITGMVMLPLADADLDALFTSQRHASAAEPLDEARERVWSRLCGGMPSHAEPARAPSSGPRINATPKRFLEQLTTAKATALGGIIFASGVVTGILLDDIGPRLRPDRIEIVSTTGEAHTEPTSAPSPPVVAPRAQDATVIPARADLAPHLLVGVPTTSPTAEINAGLTAEELEATLILRARHALDTGQPSAALAILRQHARRFPNGGLALECKSIEMSARAALERQARSDAPAPR